MAWHRGLLALARENIPAATREFEAVYDALPGEVAPKLALGVCAELSGQTDKAKEHYEVVWQRDRSYASAAFGLVRFHLTAGERGRARATLDEIPRVSPHFRAARTAAVLACVNRLGTAPETAPSAADLDEAVSRLSKGEDGGSPGAGEAGERLTAAVRRAALVWSLANPGTRLRGNRAVLGDPVTEHSLRTGLEQSYRALARQARSADEHGTLVDLANTFRPETLL
jgi:serine/threonine-protein kinase PknG